MRAFAAARAQTLIILLVSVPAYGQDFDQVSLQAKDATIRLTVIGTYRGGIYSNNTPASPPGYDAKGKRLFIGSWDRQDIDVLDISDPYLPKKIYSIDLTAYGNRPYGMAVMNGLVAVTVREILDRTDSARPGNLVIFNTSGQRIADPVPLEQPNRLAFTPSGRKLVVTLSGSPSDNYNKDPDGAIAIIDLGTADWRACNQGADECHISPTVTIADFKAFNDKKDELVAAGARFYGPNNPTVAQDAGPEWIAVSRDSRLAWVTLQQNNALAVVDLHRKKVTHIMPLGYKDHSVDGNGFDASDVDNAINIKTWPVRSFYMPDAISVLKHDYQKFLITVNEGDPKDYSFYTEKIPVKDLPLDPTYSYLECDYKCLQQDANLGRLQATKVNGDDDGDGLYEQIYMVGARSFSVWTVNGRLVFDSGDQFEQITAAAAPELFNATEDSNKFDQRSIARGPEPEELAVGRVGNREYVFICFERIGGIIVYDVSIPAAPAFQQYINNRNPAADPVLVCGPKGQPETPDCRKAGDLEPEGLLFIPKEESPIDAALLVVSHELSDSTTVYRVDTIGQ